MDRKRHVAALIAQRRDVRGAMRAFAGEALGEAPTRDRALDVEGAIRAGICDAAADPDPEARAAAEEALKGLEDALAERGVG